MVVNSSVHLVRTANVAIDGNDASISIRSPKVYGLVRMSLKPGCGDHGLLAWRPAVLRVMPLMCHVVCACHDGLLRLRGCIEEAVSSNHHVALLSLSCETVTDAAGQFAVNVW